MDAIIVDKSDGSQHRQSVTGLQLDEASVVKLPIAPESVVSFEQNGNDLLIVMASGETIVIGDFFIDFDDERNELILVDDDGIAWWGQYSGPWSDFAFAEIGADGVAPFPFAALGGLGAAAAGGLAFGAGGGSEDAASVFPVVDVQDIADDPAGDRVTVRGSSTGDYVVVSYPDENGNIVTSDPIAVDEDGNWSYDLPRDNIAEGDVDVIGTVTDENGNPVQDENGNPISDSETANLDLTGPTVAVDIENDGQSGTVTFTFSEAVTGFGMSDVSVNNGTLSNLTQVDDHTWTATVTPAATGDVSVEVTEGSYTDLAGNAGTKGSDTEGFDRTAPTVDVVITDNGQDGELVLTFSPDTDRDSFDPSVDLVLDNADLGTDGTWSEDGDGNQVWTVTITPTGTGEVTATVTDGSYLDTAGNAGEEGSDTENFDVAGPSVVVDIENNGQSGTVTFTFSEAVTGFAASDVSVGNGTLSNLTQVDDHTWTATVTPAATGDVSVEVTEGSYTDLAGNAGTKGSDTEGFDRTAPTVDVVITDNGQDGELVLTFSPDTDRDSFDPSVDLVLDNADLGTDGTWSEDGDGNQVWTVTITPTGTGEVTATVTDGSYLDTDGNAGEEGSDTEVFDVDGPSVIVDIENNGQSGTVTFTFSEAVTGFAASDVSVGNGTLSGLTQVDDHTWTATVTPAATGDVSVEVTEGSYTDLAGNAGTKGSDTEGFDRTAPTVGVVITDNGQDGELVLTFSPDTDRGSFDPSADLVLDNADLGTDGTWSEDGDGNQVWTVTITPTGTGEVTATVTDGSYLDTAGNAGEEGSDTEVFDVDGPSVVVDIENNGQSGTVTFTFSEAVTGFAASDVSVGNGTLSGLTQVDDHTWTATVTPEKAGGDVSVTVGEDSYADLAGNLGSSGTDTEAFDRYEPLAEGDHSSLTLAGDDFKSDENFNVAFVLDFSGSVNNSEADQMLQAVKAAGQAFFEGTTGDVQIQLVAFSSDAQSTVSFSNYADFAAQIAAWENQRPYNGGTDYTAAVDKTMEAFQPLDDYNNRVFFMSDGEPTEQTTQHWNGSNWVVDHSLDSDTENAWNEFVANNNIDVQTVGIGQGVTVPRLQDVDEADGDNHVIQVSNFDDLVDDLLDVIREVDVAGNVLNGNDGIAGTADDDLLGVDGGRILSIAVDGEVYTYDLSGITDSNGGAVADGSILNVETDQGGRLVFDFETGDWTYTANPDTATGTETFDYVLTDDSGDTSSATLTIDVEAAPEAATMSFDAETSGAGEDASVFTMAAADLSVATLGLSAVDEATADDDSASSQPEDAADIALDDLVYEDSGESLDAYLPEESVSIASSAETAASPSDSGATASLSLDEIENHAALVG